MDIKVTKEFEKSFKKLLKKDTNLINEFENLLNTLRNNPLSGTHLGNGRYKIRVKNHSNNKGKSGGYRVITYAKIEDTLLMVYIYSKSDTENLSDTKIHNIIKNYKV